MCLVIFFYFFLISSHHNFIIIFAAKFILNCSEKLKCRVYKTVISLFYFFKY
jgi:hypothetical protein